MKTFPDESTRRESFNRRNFIGSSVGAAAATRAPVPIGDRLTGALRVKETHRR